MTKEPEKIYPPVAERLQMVLDYYRTNMNQLSIKMGLANNAGISKIIRTNAQGMSMDLLQKLIAVYPDLNARWLLTGEGEMVAGEPEAVKCNGCRERDRTIERLNNTIGQLNQSLEHANEASQRAFSLAELYKLKIDTPNTKTSK